MRAVALVVPLMTAACAVPAGAQLPSATPASTVVSTQVTPRATPTPARGAPPVAAGAATEAGVLFVSGPDDWIYRYDGATGRLERVARHAVAQRSTAEGVYVEGFEGGLQLLRWDGSIEHVECGPGRFQLAGPLGACLSYDAGGPTWVRLAGENVRLLLPAEWGAGEIAWSPDARRLALLRSKPGASFDERAHNELWLIGTDGTPRLLYAPRERAGFVFSLKWSPDGRWLTAWEQPIVSNSWTADGDHLLLFDTQRSTATDLGPTLVDREWLQWSPAGDLAYVKGGGRETWQAKQLVVRAPDGTEVSLTDASHVGLAPAWEPSPDRDRLLLWIGSELGDGNGGGYAQGIGPGDRYGVEGGLAVPNHRLAITGIVEGLRPSADGKVTLALIRRPSLPPVHDEYGALELWLLKPHGGGMATQLPLVTGLGGLDFGFYGSQPSLFSLVAWSLDPR